MATRFAAASILLAVLSGSLPAAPPPLPPDQSRAVFEKLKALTGTWKGKSTRGWTNTSDASVIAGGSVLVSRSAFDDDPGEDMLTVIHLDGERLMLTHYCQARNQPRLIATSADATSVTFEFLDGTSLSHRDHGHMDKVVYRFGDGDSYSSRWTWYQDGKERWLEEISYQRRP